MDQEVEDILSNDDSTSSEDEEGDIEKLEEGNSSDSSGSDDSPPPGVAASAKPQAREATTATALSSHRTELSDIAAQPVSLSESSSSSDDSMTGEYPRGMKRRKFGGGEASQGGHGGAGAGAGSPDDDGGGLGVGDDDPLERFKRGEHVDDSYGYEIANQSDDDDGEEDRSMAAQLEREFLGDSNSNF